MWAEISAEMAALKGLPTKLASFDRLIQGQVAARVCRLRFAALALGLFVGCLCTCKTGAETSESLARILSQARQY